MKIFPLNTPRMSFFFFGAIAFAQKSNYIFLTLGNRLNMGAIFQKVLKNRFRGGEGTSPKRRGRGSNLLPIPN